MSLKVGINEKNFKILIRYKEHIIGMINPNDKKTIIVKENYSLWKELK